MADHFALEVTTREPPPWVKALDAEELAFWTAEVLDRAEGPYDHPSWFFGISTTIPRWTGYSVGYALVAEYLTRVPGARAWALVGEPAASFVPPSD